MGLGGLVWEGEWCPGGKEPWRGFCTSTSSSKLLWASGTVTVTEARTAKQMEGICCGQDEKPRGSASLPSLCVFLSSCYRQQLRRKQSRDNRMGRS